MEFENNPEPGRCFACGCVAPWIILIAGEDESPHEEWACELHARGHWRWALVTPPSSTSTEAEAEDVVMIDQTGARYAW